MELVELHGSMTDSVTAIGTIAASGTVAFLDVLDVGRLCRAWLRGA
jgi:hypothetical protein